MVLNRKDKDFLHKLVNKYGVIQLFVAVEELSELQKELCKFFRGSPKIENIKEEIADVIIMLYQLKDYFMIEDKELQDIVKYKLERTKERLGFTNESKN